MFIPEVEIEERKYKHYFSDLNRFWFILILILIQNEIKSVNIQLRPVHENVRSKLLNSIFKAKNLSG